MQTFLPFKSFQQSAMSLDVARLGKQRAETKQLLIAIYRNELLANLDIAENASINLKALKGTFYVRMTNHPACKMWMDHPFGLLAYGVAICKEWQRRGYADNVLWDLKAFNEFNYSLELDQGWLEINCPSALPPWLGDARLHISHRSKLIEKDPSWYKTVLGWTEQPGLNYFWPSDYYYAEY